MPIEFPGARFEIVPLDAHGGRIDPWAGVEGADDVGRPFGFTATAFLGDLA